MTKTVLKAVLTGTALLILATPAMALQTQMNMVTMELFEIPELGAEIADEGAGPKIMRAVPPEGRLDAYKSVDIQTGDMVMSANGSQIKTMDDLRAVIDAAGVGDTVRLALKRGTKFSLAAYVVADADLTDEAVKISTAYWKDHPDVGGGRRMVKMSVGEDVVPWIDLAVLLTDGDAGVTVKERIEMPKFVTEDVALDAGDIITTLQGESVKNCESFITAYGAIEIGQNVALKVKRSGATVDLTFTKPELPVQNVIMRNK
jgi:S1-C subfamily serine protease